MKKLLLGLLLATPLAHASVDLAAKADAATCKQGLYCKLWGHHTIVVRNDTDTDKNYHYTASVCADNGDCWTENRDFGVGPHQTYERRFDSAVITRFSVVMAHYNYVTTQVRGAENKYLQDRAYVQVNY
jgi:hypothetical protein